LVLQSNPRMNPVVIEERVARTVLDYLVKVVAW
jgi:hypothetical protein